MVNSNEVFLGQLGFDPKLDIYDSFLRVRDIVPEAPALLGDTRNYSYSEMADATDRMAWHLMANGVRPGDNVVMITDRSPEAIITMAAIMRAGGVYVPLDPAYATEQMGYVIADAKPSAILWENTYEDLARSLKPEQTPLIRVNDLLDREPSSRPAFPTRHGRDSCCILYTSGSTGAPKGVVLPHWGVTRLGFNQPIGQAAPGDVVLHSCTIACDASVWEIWPTLLTGATVAVLCQPKPSVDGLANAVQKFRSTILYQYSGIFNLLIEHRIEALSNLRLIVAGGDVMSLSHVRSLLAKYPKIRVVNGYGPTENSVFTTFHEVCQQDLAGGSIPIGLSTAHCDCFVVDDDMKELGDEEVGQLLTGGPGVALGYLNQPQRTAESFIDDPRPGHSGKVYKTGDLVRRRKSGVYEFLGRVDRQIKIGGRRVELDEIEHNLRELPMLTDAAVVLTTAKTGDKRIASFLKPSGALPADERGFIRDVMAALGEKLPQGMHPRVNRVIAEFPLTVNGKIDRKALVRSLEEEQAEVVPAFRSARARLDASEIAKTIASVWDGILGCGPLDDDATFFEAGGTSLQLIDAHAELAKRLGVSFDITLMFEVARLGALSKRLAEIAAKASVLNRDDAGPTPAKAAEPEPARAPLDIPENAVAIIGIAAKTPGSANIDEFWEHIRRGDNLIRRFTPDEIEDSFSPVERASANYVPVRPGLPDAGLFDAKFFSMYPREAAVTDPQARVFLELCYHAMEDAGHDPWRTRMPVGVFAGSSLNTYLIHNVLGDRAEAEEFTSNYQTGKYAELTGNLGDCLATRVAYKLDLNGPALTVQTACSTSLTAISQAMVNLRAGTCDMALAGGVSISFPQNRGYMTQEGGLASDDGTCRPFDAEASGTVFSHGAGVVVLRRLKDALAAGDNIYAVIRGFGINNDGADKISFPAPTVAGQAASIRLAHADAGVSADSISYVECHGTATPLGDPIEISGLRQAFGDGLKQGSCALGSVKGNLGHMDAAAGVIGVIKTALMLKHRELPQVANFKSLNPKIALADSPFHVPSKLSDWTALGPLRAGVSSFGVGGTNVHVVIEEAPALEAQARPEGVQVVTLSAKSPEALTEMQAALADAIARPAAPHLADIAFTLQEGRPGFAYRMSVAGNDPTQVVEAIHKTPAVRKAALPGNPRIAFMFPGQGSQYPGMGSGLYRTEPEFAKWIDRGAEILRPILGVDIKSMLCFGNASDAELARALRETRLTQPALYLTQYACARLWMARGITPAAMIGHSVGEFAAAALADVMDFETGLSIIAKRGQLMHDQPGGAMLSVRAPLDQLEPLLDGSVDIATMNAPRLNVLAGTDDAIARIAEKLEKAGIACSTLHTSHAFHSRMMDPVCDGLEHALSNLSLRPSKIPYVSCVTGKWITETECTSPAYWARQARQAVRFADALTMLVGDDPTVLLEVGAGNTLSTFASQTLPREASVAVVQSLPDHARAETDELAMAGAFGRLWCAGVAVDWSRLGSRGANRVSLPGYAFQRKLHWVEPAAQAQIQTQTQAPASATIAAPAVIRTEGIIEMSSVEPTQTIDRKPRLVAELLVMLSEISGESLGPDDAAASFLELGFDSLFLGQVTQKLSADYGTNLTFRQLLSDYPSIEALATYLDESLPPELATPAPAAIAQSSAALVPPAIEPISAPVPATAPSQPADGAAASLMQQQVAAMQALFAQQLQVISGAVPATAQTAAIPSPGPVQAPVSSVAPAAINPPVMAAPASVPTAGADASTDEEEPQKRGFAIGRATNAGGGDLTPQQMEFVRDLAKKYSARSPKSKAYVQRYRPVMADPRTAAGFRAEWKEMVYPVVCDRSKGSRIWDIDGNEYIDLVNGFGQTAFGHSPDFVIEAVTKQMERGFAIGPQSDLAGPIAERFARFVGHERATFCNTGSEAVMAAMRIARSVTGRDRIVVFSNDYHGQFDEVLVKGKKRGGDPAALPIAPGIPRTSLSNMTVLPYGAAESLSWISDNISSVAAVIVEPVQSRHPDFRPREFVQSLRHVTADGGAALVMDEVVTGFRVGPRGMQGLWDIQPDMATYGKVVGGGMPIGMLAGSARFMDALDGGMWQFGDGSIPEASPTFFAGTFVRHPLILAAVNATLSHMEEHGDELWRDTAERTANAVRQMNGILTSRGLLPMIETFSSWFVPHLADNDPNAVLLFPLMRMGGVHIQVGYPCIFTTCHTDDDIRRVVEVFEQSVDTLRSVGILVDNESAASTPAIAAPAVSSVSAPAPTVPTRDIPLTETQREIWMTSQLGAKASCSFNESISMELEGPLDRDALQTALDRVIDRHDGLRQIFARNGETFDIAEPFSLPLMLHDLSNDSDADAALAALLSEDAATEIDLVEGPPLRAFLVRRSMESHVLVINAHHIVCDGWSYNVLLSDLVAFYTEAVGGAPANLPEAPSFAAHAMAQADRKALPETQDYWRAQYADLPDLPDLPADRPRPAMKSFSGATCTAHIPGDVMRAARKAGAAQGCTLFATLFAAVQIVVGRLSGSQDVVLGIPTGGQALLDNSDMVGHCVNFLPIRAPQDPAASTASYLAKVRDQVMNAFDHQNYTYGTLVQDLAIERSLNRLPLTEIQFNLERLGESMAMGPVTANVAPNPKTAVNFDLFFNMVERRDGLRVDVDYNSDVYDAATVKRWIGHLETVLTELARDTERPLAELPIQDEDELRWLADTLNATPQELPDLQTVHELFIRQAASTPDAIAIEDGTASLTYAQLDQCSNAIAATIQALDIGTGGRIAVALPRSVECVAALLGVMKSANAYVPIDPSQPAARLRLILEAAKARAILHDHQTMPDYATELELKSVPVTRIAHESAPVTANIGGDPTAYVMFTSGSTGAPKGVEVGHRAVVNLLTSMAREPGFDAQSTLLALTTTMFDISVLEMFLPLISGGRTVIAPPEDVLDGFRLVDRLKKGDITHLQATPTLWTMLLEAGLKPEPGLTMLAGGEALASDLAEKLTAGGATLWNVYGPTETTIWSARARIEPGAPVTIGQPIGNTELHVLDAGDRLVPIGAVGELNIGGLGLARGYFQRPDLTEAAFRQVTLLGRPRKLYKTGDLARRRADGTIEVLGRNDGQIKLRGFRIELGEVEAGLRSIDGVQAAAAALRPSPRGGDQLVGYVVSEPGPSPRPELLGAALGDRVPGYMVPTAWVFMSSLPQTANGKLDRKALPDPDIKATVTALNTAPATPTERNMAEIWESVLGIKDISTSQTLFSLGADSLTVFRIAARMIDAEFNLEARHLLQYPSIARMAAFADSRNDDDAGRPAKPSLKSYRRGAQRGL